MHVGNMPKTQRTDLKTPVRNRYFYGKLLDVHHFELETNYLNAKRWLLNRLISGYGVVCGLGVELCYDGKSIIVQPGVAIDKWGREIIVPEPSKPAELPHADSNTPQAQIQQDPEKDKGCHDGNWVHVDLCFHECESDPVPVMAGDCKTVDLCAPGAIRERYRISIEHGKIHKSEMKCVPSNFFTDGHIDREALAKYVTGSCPELRGDSCIPLANILIAEGGVASEIDITIRPIVYTNDLLFKLLYKLTTGEENSLTGEK